MKKNIFVGDDSALMRRVICDIINADSNLQVAKECRNGKDALETLRTEKFDCVLLDVNMPVMDGLQLLQMLQKEHIAATVIMVSTLTLRDADVTIRALELGAVDFVTKPENLMDAKSGEFGRRLISMIDAVLRLDRSKPVSAQPSVRPMVIGTKHEFKPVAPSAKNLTQTASKASTLIALASSTGGPNALHQVIPFLPKDMKCPMVIVQHMPAGFTKSMAERLDELSQVHVKEAEDNEPLVNGWVYIAPGGKHMRVVKQADGSHRIALSSEPAIGGLRPCADVMYESLESSGYSQIVCVVLTGMGSDGTKGITGLSKKKRIQTIAQNADTCVVYGMPRAIAETGIVNDVVPLDDVAKTIIKKVGVS